MVLASLALLSVLSQAAQTPTAREVTLRLPHALHSGETAWIEVKLGVLERGAEIRVATMTDRTLGVISPYGVHSGHEAGSYMIQLPADAIAKGCVSLKVSLVRFGRAPRPPTNEEVKNIKLGIAPNGGHL